MSIHIKTENKNIADTVLIVGDPLRAKHIAERYLSDYHCYNEVRGACGYTGFHQKQRLSVQSVGMGMPSAAIYIHELIDTYKVKRIIRIGTAGSVHKHIKLKEIILATTAATDSNMVDHFFPNCQYLPTADFNLLADAKTIADDKKLSYHLGAVLSTDHFYGVPFAKQQAVFQAGLLAIEMEVAILYALAAKANIASLSILTISDNLVTGELMSANDRQTGLNEAIKLALAII